MRVEPRYPLDHPIRRAGNDRRIYGVVQVAVSTHLAKPPAFAQNAVTAPFTATTRFLPAAGKSANARWLRM